jgi:NhaA family Na+:H+ antiporter
MNSWWDKMRKTINLLQEFSIPLIAGVFVALLVANMNMPLYHALVHAPVWEWGDILTGNYEHHEEDEAGTEHAPAEGEQADSNTDEAPVTDESAEDTAAAGDAETKGGPDQKAKKKKDIGYYLSLHFLINDIFMVFFFGIAAKEITEACLPGGPLNPIKKAINPLMGTLGGVLGPVGVFFILNAMMGEQAWVKGWGIPTATDIALAWLVARMVFGATHPAVSFLLLVAVADDAIGLGIIAFAYPNPNYPTLWLNTAWILPGMAIAYALRRMNVQNWVPYILFGGAFAWWGLYSAHLHPALALVLIVPFLPAPKSDLGLFEEENPFETDEEKKHAKEHPGEHGHHAHSPLENFEHQLKFFVDFGLFFFAFANAGVAFAGMNNLTWIILFSLLIGKTVGIAGFSWVADKIGFSCPDGMELKHLVVAGVVAGMGLTVALFVSAQAFTDLKIQGAAKMGALFSGGIFVIAFVLGKMLGVKDGPADSNEAAKH